MEFNEIRKEANNKVLEIMRLINEGINLEILNDLDSIQYRIKSNSSITGKMKKVGDNIYNVYDLIGIRYIFHNLKYYKKLKDYIVNNSNFEIVEIKNYLEDGHPEDPNYKALHIRMKYQKFPCEVEFMDVKMAEHVVRTHDDYKKGLLK